MSPFRAASSDLLTLNTLVFFMYLDLQFETFFRPEDHTDWEIAPPSYDP